MVKLQVQRGDLRAVRGDLVFVPFPEGDVRAAVRRLDRRLATALARRLGAGAFRGRTDELLVHHGERTTAFLGIGRAPVADDAWRRAGARARQEAERQRARRVAVYLGENGASREVLAAFGEGFLLAGYRFGRYLSNDDGQRRVERLAMVGETVAGTAALRPVVSALEAVVREVFRARDLVNEPASVKTPRFLAEQATALAVEIPGLEVEVWDAERIARENLAGLLAVARGSREEPRFIILRYAGAAAGPHVALVGKAITFDSGGLSLKPAKSMETMKYDMAGGAAVIGGVAAAARLGLPVRVTGYVPATENLPGGSAQKPGDVIRYRNGKTVEVLNTDAEGRLILADALALAALEKPDVMIDVATLTGACRVALGSLFAAVMGNDRFRGAAAQLYATGSFWCGATSMAAALATIDVLEAENGPEHMRQMGQRLRDGIRRGMSNRGCALVREMEAPVIGRVSMDQTTLDITHIPGANVGDVATFFGEDGGASLPLASFAAASDTIPHEALTSIGGRVARVYRRSGRVAKIVRLAGATEVLSHMPTATF